MAVLAKKAGRDVVKGDNHSTWPSSPSGPNWPMRLTIAYGVQAVIHSKASDKIISAVLISVCLRCSRNDMVVLLKDTLISLVANRVISLEDRTIKRKMTE